MLSGSVDSLKRLFVQKARVVMLISHFFHNFHCQLIVINRDIGCLKNRCQFMLGRRHLVVFGFDRDSELPEFLIQIVHIFRNVRLNHSEIMILHLLSFRGRSANQCPSRKEQILSFLVIVLFNQEILLLGADCRVDTFHILISNQVKHFDCFC